MAAAFADLGFAGTYLIYDLQPMILMQRYWLRYSGIPAHLGPDLPRSREAVLGQLVLESSLSSILRHRLDMGQLPQSLFIGTYSLTESDLATREQVRPLMRSFGVILLAFLEAFDSFDNVAYLRALGRWLRSSHQVLVWHKGHDHWYFLAVRFEVGQVHCDAAVNCGNDTLHRTLRFNSSYRLVEKAGCAPGAAVADVPPSPGLDETTSSIEHPSGLTFRMSILEPGGPEDDSDKIGRIRRGTWEAAEDPHIQRILDSDPNCSYPVFVDGGAAFGYYSLLAAQKHPCREVQAFNPHPMFAYAMRLNLEDNARAHRIDPSRVCINRLVPLR
uniref:Uncharacterized protein n=1 Tax=Alexandrium monilatum TaxID=311494 RepID=A0A7S4V5B2_9DINO